MNHGMCPHCGRNSGIVLDKKVLLESKIVTVVYNCAECNGVFSENYKMEYEKTSKLTAEF